MLDPDTIAHPTLRVVPTVMVPTGVGIVGIAGIIDVIDLASPGSSTSSLSSIM
ncbi:MAG: hypothetical protein ACJ8CR_34535 [Roseiflexaceae bacterium]